MKILSSLLVGCHASFCTVMEIHACKLWKCGIDENLLIYLYKVYLLDRMSEVAGMSVKKGTSCRRYNHIDRLCVELIIVQLNSMEDYCVPSSFGNRLHNYSRWGCNLETSDDKSIVYNLKGS